MKVQILHAGISQPSPYFHNFYQALKKYDPEINISINPAMPVQGPSEPGIVHFHRLKRFYDSNSQESAENFIENSKKAKEMGWKFAWTIHNFFPIDREISHVDSWVTNQFAALSDTIFTHTELMKKSAEKLFSKRVINCSYAIHNFEGINDGNNLDVPREDYELVFTFGGDIVEYKCIPKTIESFKRLKEEFNNRRLRLIIAGPSRGMSLEKQIDGDEDILFHNSFIGQNGWKELRRVTDIFLTSYDLSLPAFRYGFFPSSVPQLLSYKKPMILPDCPETREFIPQQDKAIFYDFYDKNGLFKAMKDGLDSSRRDLIRRNLEEVTETHSWDHVAKIVIEEYNHLLEVPSK